MEGAGTFAWFYAALALATGFGIAIAATAGAGGLGRGLQSAVESIARQPEAAGAIRGTALIGLALIEALTIYMILVSVLLWTKIPTVVQIGELLRGG
ncbi:MAG: ATP synthase F0 subunit C [bacterium JZ-2024 1]